MLRFLVRRILSGLAILLIASFLFYVMVDAVIDPLDDLRISTDPSAPIQMEQRIQDLKLDVPSPIRYLEWLGNFVTGDLGVAWRTGRSVTSLLQGAIISTIQLVTVATVLSILLGVGIGIISALRQYSAFDYVITFVAFLFFSLPSFWVAVLLKQWGAIGFNDFLADPNFSWAALIGIGLVFGLFWMLAVGGDARRRATVFGAAFLASFGLFYYLQVSGWWTTPNINFGLLLLLGVASALGVTVLSTGLANRRSLGAALTSVGVGLVFYFILNYWLWDALTPQMTYALLVVLGIVAAAVGVGIGLAWGGPDRWQSARTAAIVSVMMGVYLVIDRVMQVWPAYMNATAINGRPIATIGDRTPNLGGNFWVGMLDSYTHLIMPTIALMLISFAGYTRYSRASMLEVLGQDYIRTARAKGLNERTVIMRHGFRNSLIPLATIIPVDVITLIGGAIITERIFSRPGMGTLFLQSLNMSEIDPVMAYLMIVSGLAILANIVADLIYTALDPRIRVNA